MVNFVGEVMLMVSLTGMGDKMGLIRELAIKNVRIRHGYWKFLGSLVYFMTLFRYFVIVIFKLLQSEKSIWHQTAHIEVVQKRYVMRKIFLHK